MPDNNHESPEEILYRNKLLEALFKNSTDAIAYFDQQNRIIDINRNFQELFGYSLAEVEGFAVDDIMDMSKPNSANREYTENIRAGKTIIAEDIRHTKQGSPVEVMIKGIPVVINDRFCGGYAIYSDITERKKTANRLQERERQLNSLLDNIPGMFYRCRNDASWTMEYISNGCLKLTGYKPRDLIDNKTVAYNNVIHPDYRKSLRDLWQLKLSQGLPSESEYLITTSSGENRWVWERGKGIYNKRGKVLFIEGFITDINERKIAEQALLESENKYKEILSTIKDGYFEVNLKGKITFCNEAAARMLGYHFNEFIGISYREICKNHQYVFDTFNNLFQTGTTEHVLTTEMIQKDGSEVYGELTLSVIYGRDGTILGFRGLGRDVTERIRYEEQLKYLSLHDQLTDLYNRTYFENELDRLNASREYPVTIISIDLDGLKLVNDTVGHEEGDQLLVACARALKKALRRADILARVGGDEFVALLPRTNGKAAETISERINEQVEKYNLAEPDKIPLSISVGLATAEGPGKPLRRIFKEADDLMYRAKLHKGVDTRSQIIKSLLATLGERDFITAGHARRLEDHCIQIGEEIGLSTKQLSDLRLLAQVHDLGKVGTPDQILFKKGALSLDETKLMRQHSEKGYRIALASTDLAGIADLILKHHERWDGNGYPLGLRGEDIPIECRILAIADAFDAMTNDRPYRRSMQVEKAVAELKANAGTQFDPGLVEIFLALLGKAGRLKTT